MINYTCDTCGEGIDGDPYSSTLYGWCANVYVVSFCSKECYEESIHNSSKWPESPAWIQKYIDDLNGQE